MHKDTLKTPQRRPKDAQVFIETCKDALRQPSDAPRRPSFHRDAKDAPSFYKDTQRYPKIFYVTPQDALRRLKFS